MKRPGKQMKGQARIYLTQGLLLCYFIISLYGWTDYMTCRNKNIENVITIDLHGQHVKQGMKLLKLHLLFGAYVRCKHLICLLITFRWQIYIIIIYILFRVYDVAVRLFRVITGCGSHGLGKSKLKQSV